MLGKPEPDLEMACRKLVGCEQSVGCRKSLLDALRSVTGEVIQEDAVRLYSDQNRRIDNLRYDVPSHVRNRLIAVIQQMPYIERFMRALEREILGKYGHIDGQYLYEDHIPPAIKHLLVCENPQVCDFLILLFRVTHGGPLYEPFVEKFNEIFREEGIGYELTPMTHTVVKGGGSFHGRTMDDLAVTYPTVRRLDNTVLHQEMKECLTLLSKPEFKTANDEFAKAHEHYRQGRFDEAVALCCSAFESVMKTLLDKKGVTPKPNATCNPLVQQCIAAGIITTTYEPCMVSVGVIRNALSDAAHGRGPGSKVPIERGQVEHLLHLAATNMVYLSRVP